MENTLVSARISSAKKDAGVNVLNCLGASTTELINSAFDYVIENKQLPKKAASCGQLRADSVRDFAEFFSESTLEIDWNTCQDASAKADDFVDYKEIVRSGKAADYESLA
jgi:antitoxin component of RelBE/YafQ-DinJ toxin-antitoxin module